jgi:cytochrome bd-type quinol oxidase subunit 2
MKQLITNLIVIVVAVMAPVLMPAAVYADCPTASDNSSKDQVIKGIGETGSNCSTNGVTDLISSIVNILSIVVGAVAIIMVIISGFRYITSSGDANKASSARSTLVYALVGVAIAALAQFLVHFVLDHASGAVTT